MEKSKAICFIFIRSSSFFVPSFVKSSLRLNFTQAEAPYAAVHVAALWAARSSRRFSASATFSNIHECIFSTPNIVFTLVFTTLIS